MIKKHLLGLVALLVIGTTHVAEAQITIFGARSCGSWVKERPSKASISRTAQQAWLMGYLSGLASGTSLDALKDGDAESFFLWVDNYCQTNPLNNIADAGTALFLELRLRQGL
jgi:hypothetical protein